MFIIVQDLKGREIPVSTDQICAVTYVTEPLEYQKGGNSEIRFSSGWGLTVRQSVPELIEGLKKVQQQQAELSRYQS